MDVTERVARARMLLMLDHPFFGSLCVRLKCIEDRRTETATTNGKEIRYNPEWIGSLSDSEIQGMLAHEVSHLANGHPWRRDSRKMTKWNQACDFAINPILIAAGLELPAGAYAEDRFDNLSAEAVYARLQDDSGKDKQQGENGKGEGGRNHDEGPQGGTHDEETEEPGKGPQDEDEAADSDFDEDADYDEENESDRDDEEGGGEWVVPQETYDGDAGQFVDAEDDEEENTEVEWRMAAAAAAQMARGMGSMPAGMERLIDEFIDPKVPWEVYLRDFVERSARNDYTWTMPNPRYLNMGIILPRLISEELPAVVIVIDTSASITKRMLSEFVAEASAVLMCYDTTIHMVYADATVNKTETYTRADMPISAEAVGGGGTDFRPAFKWTEEQGIEPSCLIYLTDLEGRFPEIEPEFPVLWIVPDEGTNEAPFGITVRA